MKIENKKFIQTPDMNVNVGNKNTNMNIKTLADIQDELIPTLSAITLDSNTDTVITVEVDYQTNGNTNIASSEISIEGGESKTLIEGINTYEFTGLTQDTAFDFTALVISTGTPEEVKSEATFSTDITLAIPVISPITQDAISDTSVTVSISYEPGMGTTGEVATIEVVGSVEGSVSLISGSNQYIFTGLTASTGYDVDAKVVTNEFGDVTQTLAITTTA